MVKSWPLQGHCQTSVVVAFLLCYVFKMICRYDTCTSSVKLPRYTKILFMGKTTKMTLPIRKMFLTVENSEKNISQSGQRNSARSLPAVAASEINQM